MDYLKRLMPAVDLAIGLAGGTWVTEQLGYHPTAWSTVATAVVLAAIIAWRKP